MFSKTKEPNPLNFFECRKITKKPDGLQMLKINFDHTETSEHMEKWILENIDMLSKESPRSKYPHTAQEHPPQSGSRPQMSQLEHFWNGLHQEKAMSRLLLILESRM